MALLYDWRLVDLKFLLSNFQAQVVRERGLPTARRSWRGKSALSLADHCWVHLQAGRGTNLWGGHKVWATVHFNCLSNSPAIVKTKLCHFSWTRVATLNWQKEMKITKRRTYSKGNQPSLNAPNVICKCGWVRKLRFQWRHTLLHANVIRVPILADFVVVPCIVLLCC